MILERNRINFLKKGLIFFSLLIIPVLLGLVSFLDRGLALGLCLLVSFSCLTVVFLLKKGKKEKSLFLVFFIAIFLYLFTTLLFHYTGFQPFGDGKGDFITYHLRAQELSFSFQKNIPSLSEIYNLPYGYHYVLIVAVIYVFTLPLAIIPEILGAWLAGLSAVLIYLIIREIGRSERSGFLIGLASIIYPSHVFYGSYLLKDTLVVPLSLAGLLLCLKLIKGFSWSLLSLFYFVLIGLTYLRFYVGHALLFTFILCWFLFGKIGLKKKIVFGAIIVFVLGFVPIIATDPLINQGYYGVNSFKRYLNLEAISFYREKAYALPEIDPGSTVVVKVRADNPFLFVKNYFESFVNITLGPFPWQMKHLRHFIALAETIPWYFFFFFIIKGIARTVKQGFGEVSPLIFFSFMVLFVMSLFGGNFGISTRIRMPAFLSLLCFAPFGFSGKKEKRRPLERDKTKITFFLPNLEVGGAEKITLSIIENLDREKFQTQLLLRELKGELKERVPNDVSILELGISNLVFVFPRLINYFRHDSSDIFVSCFTHTNIAVILAKLISGGETKIIIAEHTTFSRVFSETRNIFRRLFAKFIVPPLMRLTYPKAAAVVCVSKGVAQGLSDLIGLPLSEIEVIYNPLIDDQIFDLREQVPKHPWFGDPEVPVILAAGRLIKAKDYSTLLRALKLVLQKRKVRLVILGEGEERENLQELARKLNISENTAFLGFQKNPYKFMAAASVFVLSSKREGFASVIIESIACGTPVVSTDCQSGPSEIINDGENGFLVPVGSEKALAEAMLKVLGNPGLIEKITKEAKKQIQNFSVEKGVRNYERLFQELSANS